MFFCNRAATHILVSGLVLMVLSFYSGLAAAFTPFRVSAISVEGNPNIDAGIVYALLPITSGDLFTEELSIRAIQNIYQSGFFKRVTLEARGTELVVRVLERPAVSQIEFIGVSKSQKEALIRSLRMVGLVEGRPFDITQMYKAEQEIQRQYHARGLYATTARADATPEENNRIKVTFSVREGDVTKIRNINIIGNEVFSVSELLDQMNLRMPGWLSWITKGDEYSRQKLAADVDILRAFYQDRGYAEMQVDSSLVSISPDKEHISIVINITEGQIYSVGKIQLAGELLGMDNELQQLLNFKTGEIYSAIKISEAQTAISERLAQVGYAFSNIQVQPNINREKREIDIGLVVDPGKRIYVRRVNIFGNYKTRDYVVRRELRQFENAWFESDKIRLSRDRVDRLGFFSDVQMETPLVPGSNDQVDMNMRVEEKFTGSASAGLGYSTTEGASILLSLEQPNLFGTGHYAGLQINTAETSRLYSISTTDPYFTKEGVSRTVELSTSTTKPPLGSSVDYTVDNNTMSLRFGIPYGEGVSVSVGARYDDNYITTSESSSETYKTFVRQFGDGSTADTVTYPLLFGWRWDRRNSGFLPTEGFLTGLTNETALIGDLRYLRVGFYLQNFFPLTKRLTFATNIDMSYGKGLQEKPYPVFKNYYAGGIGTVRGYSAGSIALDGVSQSQNVGARVRNYFNAELQGTFTGGNDRSLRWQIFLDGGAVYENPRRMWQDLLYAAGVGLTWISPIGPLKFSLGYALNPRVDDETQLFQFQFGTTF